MGVHQGWNLVVGADAQKLGRKLVAGPDVDRNGAPVTVEPQTTLF